MNANQLTFIEEPAPEAPPIKQMVLVERVHYTYESWEAMLKRRGLEAGNPIQYLNLCWAEEVKWKEWCHATENKE